MNGDRYDEAVAQLASLLNLTEDAISIAQGWSILPDRLKRHVKILIDDYIASQIPQLQELYSATSLGDQLRFDRVVERVQDKIRRDDN